MGSSSSASRSDSSQSFQAAVDVPEAQYDDGLWMASCRPNSRMNVFASNSFLFQPDCRLFCPAGLKCKLLRGPRGEIHRNLFIHTTKQAVLAAAEADVASRNPPTIVVNAPEVHVALPYVSRCWSFDAEYAQDISNLPQGLSRRTVIVWIHGFRQRFFRVNGIAHHILHRCRENWAGGDSPPLVISFLWPCHKKGAAYMRARDSAELAGQRLEVLIRVLQQLGCKILVVAHSLGCRVALRALSRGDAQNPIDHLIMLGAAVRSNAFAPGAEFMRSTIAARQVVVMHSVHDEVLSSFFSIGEVASSWMHGRPTFHRPTAMGLTGVDAPIPDATRSIDVSSSVSSHNPNFWLLSPEVVHHIVGPLTRDADNYALIEHLQTISEATMQSSAPDDVAACSESWSDLILADDQEGDDLSDNDSDGSGLVYHI